MSKSQENLRQSTEPAQNTDEQGRLKQDVIADILEKRGSALESGEYFPHKRGESINANCRDLADVLRGDSGKVVAPASQLLNTVTEAVGDVQLISLEQSADVLEHLQHLQFAIVEALSHADS